MAIAEIIAEIDAEIGRLEQVRKLLSNGRNLQLGNLSGKKSTDRKKRTLSPEARKKIVDAQRKRWAAQKKASK
jgi:hypothetical protein